MAEAMIACYNIDHYTRHEDRIFKAPPANARIFLTKCPKDILVVGPLLRANPSLYVICMIRDPRDTVVSRHGKDPNKYWVSLSYWNTYIEYWRHIKDHPRLITIKYEDFVSRPDSIQDELISRWPFLEKLAPFSQYHEFAKPSSHSLDALRGIRPISPIGIGSWRNHLPRLVGQLAQHGDITQDLIQFGYEPDSSWRTVLDQINPDTSPGHLPEYVTKDWVRSVRSGVQKEALKALLRRAGIEPSWLRRRLSPFVKS
jgi:hypothetical protein